MSAAAATVLIVDDSPEDRLFARDALERHGYVVSEAASAGAGLRAALDSRPDCILLDMHMPDRSGLDVLDLLHAGGGTTSAIVMLTGSASIETALNSLKAGALDFLVKDQLRADSLWQAVRGAIERHRLMRQRDQVVARLRASEQRLQLALTAAHGASWDWDPSSGTLDVSEGFRTLHGIGADEAVTFERWLDGVHPADREDFRAAAQAAFTSASPLDVTIRIDHPELGMRWLSSRGTVHPAPPARAARLLGIDLDVTAAWRQSEALALAAQRSALAQQAAHASHYELDAGGGVVFEPSIAAVAGYSPAELAPLLAIWESHIHPEDRALVRQHRQAAFSDAADYALEYRFRRKDGREVWLADRAQIIKGKSAAPARVIGMIFDISEHKAREAQIKLLLAEVNHRAKNMLGLVQSVARMTAASQPENFIDALSRRLQALSANLDVLTRHQWQGVALADLVAAQLAHLDGGERVTVSGQSVAVAAGAAQPLGMALHELGTNAVKHGALSTPTGRIAIGWEVRDGAAGREFHMHWVETGGPRARSGGRAGFGSTILGSLIKSALGAEVRLEFLDAGLSWSIAAPADRVLDRT